MEILSTLLLSPTASSVAFVNRLRELTEADFALVMELAHSNHVVIRAMEAYQTLMARARDLSRVGEAQTILNEEKARIALALRFLRKICGAFAKEGIDITVIKTLDHWPDFGSDIDLYTNGEPAQVCALMQREFQATIAARSWGDRIAGKWNFEIPGLPESVEIHMRRLGQTGEHLRLAHSVPARSRELSFDGVAFPVASATERLLISTLQRMYRHFYFRLCDILDSAALVEAGEVNFADLEAQAKACGIWEGTATYLVLVSAYVEKYRGTGVRLPGFVTSAARFGGEAMYSGGKFLRVPILPHSAGLYRTQLLGTIRRGEFPGAARLGILPWLAAAAAAGYKLTGSDKGIW